MVSEKKKSQTKGKKKKKHVWCLIPGRPGQLRGMYSGQFAGSPWVVPWPAIVNYTDVDRASSQCLPSSSRWYGCGSWKLASRGPGPVVLLPRTMLPLPQRLSAIDSCRLPPCSSGFRVLLRLPAPAALPPLLGSPESLAFFLSAPLDAACTDGPVVQASIPAFCTMLLLIGSRIPALEGPPVQNSLEGC